MKITILNTLTTLLILIVLFTDGSHTPQRPSLSICRSRKGRGRSGQGGQG